MSPAPRYVVATGAEATTVLRRLTRAGWQAREGFAVTEPSWDLTGQRLVLFGRVADIETLRLAVLAAARGAGVVAIAETGSDLGRALLADLARIGPVRRDPDEPARHAIEDALPPGPAAGDGGPPLTPEQRALLERLANGETIAAAAAAEFLSLRTANRRIAQARQTLGVRTTREAVLAYLRHRRSS
jgi:DNA-binding NarL/FixJ family response regulator